MARFNKAKVVSTALSTGLVPVFYNACPEISKAVLKACYDGGIRVFEFTNRGDFAHEVFAELVKYAAAELPEMIGRERGPSSTPLRRHCIYKRARTSSSVLFSIPKLPTSATVVACLISPDAVP